MQRFFSGTNLSLGLAFEGEMFLLWYKATLDHLASSHVHQNDEDKSPELGVNRHSIATGLSPTPIAARESHIKHQMTLREDSYTDINDFT